MQLDCKISENNFEDIMKALGEIDLNYKKAFVEHTDTSYNYVLEQLGIDLRGTYKIELELDEKDVKKIKDYCKIEVETPFVLEKGDEDYEEVFLKEYNKRLDSFKNLLEIVSKFK